MKLDLPPWSETMTLRRLPTRLGRHMLVGARVLQQRRGMDAGLGGEGGGADIGRLTVRRAVEQLVEARASMGELPAAASPSIADLEAVGDSAVFSISVGISVTRLALPQRSPMPFSVPWIWRTPASTAASELATACPVSLWAWMPRWSPGTTSAITAPTMARDLVRHACRHWCRRARPSARRPHRPSWHRRAHSRDWPCSRRRNARSRRSASLPAAIGGLDAVADGRRGFPRCVQPSATRDVIVPALGDEADGVGLRPAGARRGRDRWRPRRRRAWSCRRRRSGARCVALLGEEARCRSDWRRDSRPRHSRGRNRPSMVGDGDLVLDRKIDARRLLRRRAACRVEEIEGCSRFWTPGRFCDFRQTCPSRRDELIENDRAPRKACPAPSIRWNSCLRPGLVQRPGILRRARHVVAAMHDDAGNAA